MDQRGKRRRAQFLEERRGWRRVVGCGWAAGRTRRRTPQLGDSARWFVADVPAPPIGLAVAGPLEGEGEAGRPFLHVPVADLARSRLAQVFDDCLSAVDSTASGLVARPEYRVGLEAVAHRQPVAGLDSQLERVP